MLKYTAPFLIIFFLAACKPTKALDEIVYYQASDFSPENEFTSGIEGPATDAEGNIYVVNFGEKGNHRQSDT